MSIAPFNTKITFCRRVNKPGACVAVSWVKVVEALRTGKWKDLTEKCAMLPKERRKAWKESQVPVLTVGGAFRYRNSSPKNLINHSGLICLDLDGVREVESLKQSISGLPYVVLVCKSISGTGLFCVVRIPPCDASTHSRYYDALQELFAERFGMATTIDRAPKNIASARYVSYDPDLYFNPAPGLFDELPLYAENQRLSPSDEYVTLNAEPNKCKVLRLINEAVTRRIDITSDNGNRESGYSDWLCIGGTLAALFGEAGRELYHRLSCLSPDYSEQETEQKFTEVLRKNFTPRIGAFVNICKKYDLDTTNHEGENDIPLVQRLTPEEDFKEVELDSSEAMGNGNVLRIQPMHWPDAGCDIVDILSSFIKQIAASNLSWTLDTTVKNQIKISVKT